MFEDACYTMRTTFKEKLPMNAQIGFCDGILRLEFDFLVILYIPSSAMEDPAITPTLFWCWFISQFGLLIGPDLAHRKLKILHF